MTQNNENIESPVTVGSIPDSKNDPFSNPINSSWGQPVTVSKI